ncbi:MAG: amidase [Alphaproteobacteria bacterium]|nr:amidase [Alphaproteobacteria bacterium]
MSQDSTLAALTASEAARQIRDGEITSQELVQGCLDRIDALEDNIGAWTHLDREYALAQAEAAQDRRQAGKSVGPLHGVPVGVKDILDTSDMPTENGTILHRGRKPRDDSAVVARLRAAGAIIMGKTVSTELAVYSPGKTKNPHDPNRTPGGSSSGSAAAVASFMVPVAVGTQTNGSVIRPASFCGVFGFKPSHGLIPRTGILKQSPPLDTVGVMGRTLEDTALMADVLIGHDARDPHSRPMAAPQISRIMAEEPPLKPNLVFIRTPVWDQAEETTKDAFRELCEHFGDLQIMDLPPIFDGALEDHRKIMEADLALSFAKEYRDGKDKLSKVLCEMIERGQQVLATDYNDAVSRITDYQAEIDAIIHVFDAILTPATAGEAPMGLDATGSPAFCTIWTLAGVPALTLPILQGPNGMPLGAQLVSAKGDDGRLFRTARWLLDSLDEE